LTPFKTRARCSHKPSRSRVLHPRHHLDIRTLENQSHPDSNFFNDQQPPRVHIPQRDGRSLTLARRHLAIWRS
jgi:hypothetical protein